VAPEKHPRGRRAGREYERIGERVSIFLNKRVWYANWQEGAKQRRKTLGTRSHELARQKARSLESELSGAVPRQAGAFDIATAVQAYLDWQDSNDRAAKTMMKYRDVLNRFAAHCQAAGVRLMHAISIQMVDEFGVQRRRDGMAAKTVYTELTIVRQWLNFAVTRRMLTTSPVAGTKLVKPKPAPRDYWRQDQLDAIVDATGGPYKAAYLLMSETGMRIGEVIHLTQDDLTLDGPTPVAHIRPKEVVAGEKLWRPKNGEERAVPLSDRAVAMLRTLPRRRRWVIDRMNGTASTVNKPANDRHILAYLKTVLAKLGLEGTNHKFRHSFCTIAVLAGVNFFTLRRWVGHVDEEALKIYVHIADEQAQLTMRELAERREADRARAAGTRPRKASRTLDDAGADARGKPARGRQGISKVSAKSPRGGRGAGGGSAKFQQSHGGKK
jgi:site-specific recombinase XerD